MPPFDRRSFLRAALHGAGALAGVSCYSSRPHPRQSAASLGTEENPERILIVLELTGANDGLNTVVPYTNDHYYRARPTLAVAKSNALALDEEFGLNPACLGFERLFKSGKMAIVHGCGFPKPTQSHFTGMEWCHTATPQGSDPHGWLGRFADAHRPEPIDGYIVNIGAQMSLAVESARHFPIVFENPGAFGRPGSAAEQKVFEAFSRSKPTTNPSLGFVNDVSRSLANSAAFMHRVCDACAGYRTPVDYGSDNDLTLDLKKVAAMIHADLPTRIYYVSHEGYDTHAVQASAQRSLLIYLSDAVHGFFRDLERIGRSDDVAMLVFTEFGRRIEENHSEGTDHGTATPVYILGKAVRGGFFGVFPSLSDLDEGNPKVTTDFRSVYGTMLQEWMGFRDNATVLKGDYPTLGVFGRS